MKIFHKNIQVYVSGEKNDEKQSTVSRQFDQYFYTKNLLLNYKTYV